MGDAIHWKDQRLVDGVWPEQRTIGRMFNDSSVTFADREAYVFEGERITFWELRKRVDQLAAAFIRVGIKKGDKISVWMPNCMEWVYAFFAAAKVGAAVVPVNTRFKAHEAEYVIGHSDSTTLLIYDKFLNIDYIALIHEICPELAQAKPGQLQAARLPSLRNIICCRTKARFDGMYNFDELMALGNDLPASQLETAEASVDPFQPVCIVYTSGSTGFPKGVMHSHKMLRNRVDCVERMSVSSEDTVVLFVPLFHVYGLCAGIIDFAMVGGRIVLMETYDCLESLKLMERERATLVYAMEPIYLDYVRHPELGKFDLTSLRTGIFPAGTPDLAPLVHEVHKKLCHVRSAYGMTELTATGAITFQEDSTERTASASGFPLPGFHFKIVDPDTGKTMPPNEIGEICVKGYAVMSGYYKKPEETAKAIDSEGYMHSGDLGILDEQGYLRFAKRLKEIFRVGGENADPVEVETLLLRHPSILTAKVTGVPDTRLGEVAAAFVQFKPGEAATEQELIDFCKGKIANFKVPRYVIPTNEYPMTASGKVQKFRLREIAVQRLGLEETNK